MATGGRCVLHEIARRQLPRFFRVFAAAGGGRARMRYHDLQDANPFGMEGLTCMRQVEFEEGTAKGSIAQSYSASMISARWRFGTPR